MIARALGKTSVHPVGLGCMSLSGFYGPSSEAQALSLLASAIDLGVNFLDTANVYGLGVSETRIGKFFAEDRSRRAKVTLASKFAISRDAEGKRFIDNSPAHLVEALEGSLKRLGVDHVDLYYVHRLDLRFPIEETVGALARQVKAGKIGAIGLSEISPDTLRRAHAVHPIAAVQSEYSLWTRGPELGMLQACRELGVAFVAFSPLARGALSGRVRDIEALGASDFRRGNPRFRGLNWQRNLARIDAYLELSKSLGRDPCELAIAWVLAQGEQVLAIPGTRYADNLAADVRAAEKPLSGAEAEELARLLPAGWAAGDRYTDAQWNNIERYG
ncbi:MAG TPA: aldo/keto reductase [Roseiarcus sp.]|nr:aldo/keto reductase [Roseiarcus sp.]